MKDYPLVAVITPVHNNKEDTQEFLECLKSVTYPNYKVIIVDDGSTDGTEEMLKQEHPDVTVLKGDGNLWWALAANTGIKKAIELGAGYVLLMNNDTVGDKGFIYTLLDTAKRNPKSITFSKAYFYNSPKRINNLGWKINWLRGGFRKVELGKLDRGQYNIQRDSIAANANMLINTAFFQELGMLDYKNFPQYYSDVDFTYRAYKRGYRIICEPKSIIWNKGQGTTGPRTPQTASLPIIFKYLATDKRSSRNFHDTAVFYRRHSPKLLLPYVLAYNALFVLARSLVLWLRYITSQPLRRVRKIRKISLEVFKGGEFNK